MFGKRPVLVMGLLAVAATGLLLHSLLFSFVTDDAFISFVYARNLARHGQLVFNLGERVEGYTNFLWTLILAGLFKVGLAPEVMSRILGTACAMATFVVCAFLSRRLFASGPAGASAPDATPAGWSPWDAVPAMLLAAISGYACWASGGLETQLFTFLVTLGAALYLNEPLDGGRWWGSAVAFGLAALTRPEGLLFFALSAAHRLGAHLRWSRPVISRRFVLAYARWLAIGAAIVVPHLLWRRWYYGWWLPNTFYIKSSAGGLATWGRGGYYLMRMTQQYHLWAVPLVGLAALVIRRHGGHRRFVLYATLATASFFGYIAAVGGDFMGLFRFAMPVVPLLAVATALSLRVVLAPWPRPIAIGCMALILAGHVAHESAVTRAALRVGSDQGIDSPGYLREYTANRAAIGRFFKKYARPDDFAAVGGAGAQVYYSEIPSLDCFGLSDAYIAHRVPASNNRPGHQKYAPLEYQLARRPTIITSNYYRIAEAPFVPSPGEAADWRARGYHYVNVRVEGLTSPWYSFLERIDRGGSATSAVN